MLSLFRVLENTKPITSVIISISLHSYTFLFYIFST